MVPVGATKLTWGGNAAGSSDWFDAAVEEAGADAPARYDDSDGAPIDEIAKLSPDVILATNSGITEQEYAKLSKIAPVVAYPEAPWATPWQTSLETVGKALGRTEQAKAVEEKTQQEIDAAKEKYADLAGKSLIFGYLTTTDLSQIGIYAPQDPQVSFMHDLGLEDAPAVAGAIKPGQFYGTVSAEQAAELHSDVFLTWSDPAGRRHLLLIGDETAVPALSRILGDLADGYTGEVFVEVPSSADILDLPAPVGFAMQWFPRNGGEYGRRLVQEVRRHLGLPPSTEFTALPELTSDLDIDVWETPRYSAAGEDLEEQLCTRSLGHDLDDTYAWIAGESWMVKGLRRSLVTELGLERAQVAFMGYWREGVAMKS